MTGFRMKFRPNSALLPSGRVSFSFKPLTGKGRFILYLWAQVQTVGSSLWRPHPVFPSPPSGAPLWILLPHVPRSCSDRFTAHPQIYAYPCKLWSVVNMCVEFSLMILCYESYSAFYLFSVNTAFLSSILLLAVSGSMTPTHVGSHRTHASLSTCPSL